MSCMELAISMSRNSSSHAKYLAGSRSADEKRKERYDHLGPVKRVTNVELDSISSLSSSSSLYSIPEGDDDEAQKEEVNDEEGDEEQQSALGKEKNKPSEGMESIQTRLKGISLFSRQAKVGTALLRQVYSKGLNIHFEYSDETKTPVDNDSCPF